MAVPAYVESTASVNAYDTTLFTNIAASGAIPGCTSLLAFALSPDEGHVYTGDTNSNVVTKLTASSLAIGPQIVVGTPAGNGPRSCIVSPDNASLWITSRGDNAIYQIDTASFAVTNTISLGAGNGPAGIVITPDGTQIFVALETAGTVVAYDTSSLALLGTIATGFITNLAMAPDGLSVWGTAFLANNMVRMDTGPTYAVNATVGVSSQPIMPFVQPDNATVWNANNGATSVDRISLPGLADTPVTVAATSQNLGITPDSQFVWVGETGSTNIEVVATASNTVVHTLIGANPVGIIVQSGTYLPKPPPPPPGTVVPPLFIPRKTSLDPQDLDIDFLAIQDWANRIG